MGNTGIRGPRYERLTGGPVDLAPEAALKPHIDPSDPPKTLWSLLAFFLTEANRDFRRVKLCSCQNIFWDESKNRFREYCHYRDCDNAEVRDRVARYHKKRKKRLLP